MTAPQGQEWSHRPGCEGHDHEHVRDGYGRILRTRCLLDESSREPQGQEEPLRETCDRCGEQVVTREPGMLTLTVHAHIGDEYTPTTGEVRRFFVEGKSEEMHAASWIDRYAGEFDRWLAAHDAEVAARALREAAEAAYDEWPGGSGVHCTPEWLRVRADRIERQEATR